MTVPQFGWSLWVSLLALLWALQPLFLSQARGIVLLAALTGVLALFGMLLGLPLGVVWSAGLGLLNLTLALLITAHPPDLWLGLSTGLLLLGLLDGQQSLQYIRHCQVEAGVASAFLRAFISLSGWSLAAGLGVGVLVVQLASQRAEASSAGYMTIIGSGLFVGFFAAYLLLTSRQVGLQTRDAEAEKSD